MTSLDVATSRIGGQIVHALDTAWSDIQTRHPDVPDVVIIVSHTVAAHGHFACHRWSMRNTSTKLHEVMMSAESLQREPAETFGTLLHEAAHGIAFVRGVRDTSRDGRYHNKRFAEVAHEIGLDTHRHHQDGFTTSIPASTSQEYRGPLATLTTAIVAYRDLEEADERQPKRDRWITVKCACNRRGKFAAATLEKGPVVCGVCGDYFNSV